MLISTLSFSLKTMANSSQIMSPLCEIARRMPDTVALESGDRSVTYRQYIYIVKATMRRLRDLGIKPGNRVALQLDNSCDYAELIMSIMHLGSLVCPLSTRLPADTLVESLKDINADLLITDAKSVYVEKLPCRRVDTIELIPNDMDCTFDLCAEPLMIEADRPATIIFTSGSSGQRKGVVHSFRNHHCSALGSNENIPFGPGDRWLLSLPMHHVSGLSILFRALTGGGSVVIESLTDRPTDALRRHRITHASVVSSQL
ncbi:MAG: AMP-binding protein, partial [candidate division Zixibacteria bacterium]